MLKNFLTGIPVGHSSRSKYSLVGSLAIEILKDK